MANLANSFFKLSALLCLILVLSSCAMMGLAIPAAISGCEVGINYTFTNIAYKTVCNSDRDVEAALNKVLKKMDIKETKRKVEESKISVTAVTSNLDIYIDLEKITPTVTSIKVNAKEGFFFKDKATATEIIVQTEKTLEVKK
jgi:PBP1b-binding outer membrane lipoprotein LpoB